MEVTHHMQPTRTTTHGQRDAYAKKTLDRRGGSQRLYIWKGDGITASKPKY